ncbi:MAG: hypothetical protein K2L66_07945 [Paramuribaculum sp.]|nr:hypothetical protein [Paramuribaculum sp.]
MTECNPNHPRCHDTSPTLAILAFSLSLYSATHSYLCFLASAAGRDILAAPRYPDSILRD